MGDKIKDLKAIKEGILKARTIAISGHLNPDGDSIGSMLALGLALKSIGKKVYMLCQDEIPVNYRSLPAASLIMKKTAKRVDLAIAVDCSIIDLLGKNIPVFKKARSILEIDHHAYRKPFGGMQFIDQDAAAVGEIIYFILKRLDLEITQDIAENILTSIIVETNLFKLANVRQYTFKACADLLKGGLDFSQLAERVYGPKTRQTMMLLAVCFSRARFLKNGRIIWSTIKKKDLRKVSGKDYDADSIANEMLSIKGVKIAVLFREKSRKALRVSLRSENNIDVGKIAWNYEGGGHFDIAGCLIPNNKRYMQKLLYETEQLIDES